jgi:hypothetical protein
MTSTKRRRFSKEGLLFVLGVIIIIFELISAEVLGRPVHYEFLVLAGALCGVSGTLLGDKK